MTKAAMVGEVNERGRDLEFSELVESLLLEYAERRGFSTEDFEE